MDLSVPDSIDVAEAKKRFKTVFDHVVQKIKAGKRSELNFEELYRFCFNLHHHTCGKKELCRYVKETLDTIRDHEVAYLTVRDVCMCIVKQDK